MRITAFRALSAVLLASAASHAQIDPITLHESLRGELRAFDGASGRIDYAWSLDRPAQRWMLHAQRGVARFSFGSAELEPGAVVDLRELAFALPLKIEFDVRRPDPRSGLALEWNDAQRSTDRHAALLAWPNPDGGEPLDGIARLVDDKLRPVATATTTLEPGAWTRVRCEIEDGRVRVVIGETEHAADVTLPPVLLRFRVAYGEPVRLRELRVAGQLDAESAARLVEFVSSIDEPAPQPAVPLAALAREMRAVELAAAGALSPPKKPRDRTLAEAHARLVAALEVRDPVVRRERLAALRDADPESAFAALALGIASERLGARDEAETLYRDATRIDPSLDAAWRGLAALRLASLDVGGARAALEPVSSRGQRDAWHAGYLALAEAWSSDVEAAVRTARKAARAAREQPLFDRLVEAIARSETPLAEGDGAPAESAAVVTEVERVRAAIAAAVPELTSETEPAQVHVVASGAELDAAARSLGVVRDDELAFYDRISRTLVLHRDVAKPEHAATLVRQTAHAWLDGVAPRAPAWLDAGLADWLAATLAEPTVDPADALAAARLAGAPLAPAEELVRATWTDFVDPGRGASLRAQAAALVAHLRRTSGESSGAWPEYLSAVRSASDAWEAYQGSFGAVPADVLPH